MTTKTQWVKVDEQDGIQGHWNIYAPAPTPDPKPVIARPDATTLTITSVETISGPEAVVNLLHEALTATR